VETKNTKSQFHAKTSVGKHKVMALQQLMNFCWGWKIEIVNAQLHEKNVEQLLGNADLVVDCLDNGKARRLVQGFVRAQGTPCLHGALAPDGGLGRVVWDKDFIIDDEDVAGAETCEGGEFLPFIELVSAYLARAVQEWLDSGRQLGWQVYPISGSTKL
jgi:molybdopterin/thiamine biosynthesis adenylyltransferase